MLDEGIAVATISLIIHVTAAVILVGPQVLMFFAVVPASWLIEDDERLKRAVVGVVARRFGILAAIALVLLLVTGLYQYVAVIPQAIRQAPDSRFAAIFAVKMLLFTLLIGLIYVHTYRYARRIAALSDQVIALERDPSAERREAGRARADELERTRQRSFAFSALILATSLLTLWFGVALGQEVTAWAQR